MEKEVKELKEYKERLRKFLWDECSSAEDDKPSMISVAALLRNELLREIYKDIDNDRI